MIRRWNDKVPYDGIVVVAGDFAFGDPTKFVSRLNGEIILVSGSHDKSSNRKPQLFRNIFDILELSIKPNIYITVCHCCMRVWPRSHFNSFHLYGHSHGRLAPIGKSWDVGVDCNGFTPLSLDDILRIMEGRPDNVNLVRGKRQ
jgi:calcineurin-like phosphoesterase family protein